MVEDSKHKTVCTCHLGLYQDKRMPLGQHVMLSCSLDQDELVS